MNAYFVMHFSNVDAAAEEFLSENVFEWGALGMSEVLPFEQPEGEEDVFTRVPDRRQIDVYFGEPPAAGLAELIRARFPEVQMKVDEERARDWLAEWKKGFKPFRLVEGHWVIPSWCEPPAEARHRIWIDPGMAFGTGTHETTQLVAEELFERVRQGGSLLDVGTGTGILAILGKQLGCTPVAATEIEADSRRVGRENFALNNCEDIRLDERQIQDLHGERYDFVVANIIDGVLVRVQEDLRALVKPGGWLIVSGIIAEREKDFLDGFRIDHWDSRQQKGDWLLFAARMGEAR